MNMLDEKELFEELFNLFLKEFEINKNRKIEDAKKSDFLKLFSINCSPENNDEYLAEIQDKYLQINNNKNNIFNIKEIVNEKYEAILLNPLQISAEMLVVITPNLFSSGLNVNNINNQLAINGGIRINNELFKLLKKDKNIISTRIPYIINSYNLPYKKIVKLIFENCEKFEINTFIKNLENLIEIIKINKFKNVLFIVDDIYSSDIKNGLIENINKKIKKLKINSLIL